MVDYLRRVVGRSLAAIVPAGVLAFPVGAWAETVQTRYSISLIGLPFGTASVTGSIGPTYRIELNAKLTGFASILSASKGAAVSTGAFEGGRIKPATYATTSANSDMSRTVRMTMVNGGVDNTEITPPWDPFPDRVPVTEGDRHNIVDPMSALLMPLPANGDPTGPAACDRTIPVFDGAARFDITMSYIGSRQVKTKGYAGPVAVCSARYRPITGHRANRAGTKFMADNKQIEAWLAPVGQSHLLVPYRISVMTMIGTVVIEASNFEVSGSPTR